MNDNHDKRNVPMDALRDAMTSSGGLLIQVGPPSQGKSSPCFAILREMPPSRRQFNVEAPVEITL